MKRIAFLLILVAVGGCSFLGADEDAALGLHFTLWTEEKPDFRMTFSDGRQVRTFDRRDFDIPDAVEQFDAGPFRTATSGDLRIACSILGTREEASVTAAVSLPLCPDWRYGVNCAAGPHNPYLACFGCQGYAAQPLGPGHGFEAGDSLYVVWSGTPIRNPVLY
jgi:hypothetical protein